jgi:hypothetical protein
MAVGVLLSLRRDRLAVEVLRCILECALHTVHTWTAWTAHTGQASMFCKQHDTSSRRCQ